LSWQLLWLFSSFLPFQASSDGVPWQKQSAKLAITGVAAAQKATKIASVTQSPTTSTTASESNDQGHNTEPATNNRHAADQFSQQLRPPSTQLAAVPSMFMNFHAFA